MDGKKKLTIGILAHVDAGKTTLSEALLYISGKIRTLGRVDHRNTYLDTNALERERGITIFSKQARFSSENCDFILLDTPGHVDFSLEAERTLSLLDYAILVVSAPDGVQNHTRTLWQLLEHYGVPTFVFVNKTDISDRLTDDIQKELSKTLSPSIVPFVEEESKKELDERLALINEGFLESFLAGEEIEILDIAEAISRRELFPCLFGSALRMKGVKYLLSSLDKYSLSPVYDGEKFGGIVYKISNSTSTRLTYVKITSGRLSPRDEITYLSSNGQKISEKISQIRLYSGDKFEQTDSVSGGEICALSGLSATYVGQGLGIEKDSHKPILEPVMSYRIVLPEGVDPVLTFPKLKSLEEEEPSLQLCRNDELHQIEARLMGDIQIDLLKRMIFDRFNINCEFDTGKILYKEKISQKAIGVGHFEPLRHYAEVQLLLEPLPKGSGLVFDTRLGENFLDINWQRLILSNLYEKAHKGILTGALLTDTKITLIAGRAHLKHTEGGDFREATLRAVRNGLMKGSCTLLEPYYKFRLEVPTAYLGRALSDLQAKFAQFEIEGASDDITSVVGRAPVSELHGYTRELISYTRGQGKLFCTSDGYEPCHNEEEIVAEIGYDPLSDMENTPHSVFCAKGAGFVVLWQDVDKYKHIDAGVSLSGNSESVIPRAASLSRKYSISDDELEAIMLREFGPIKRRRYSEVKRVDFSKNSENKKVKINSKPRTNMTIIDGYNLIYSWDMLKELADFSLEKARDTLMDILTDYCAFTGNNVTLVFDAYLVENGRGSDFTKDRLRIVFTKENQTADTFIEAMMHELGPDYNIRVVTGDRLIQYSAVSSGILRMTTKEFEEEVTSVGCEIRDFLRRLEESQK